ncbi:hypothetical protein CF326_g9724 [Tilletia indica]|nr:hypothetical protein CF326_g9724 [Tilletia indica]
MLARIDDTPASTRQAVSASEQRSRLQHYLTARMEAVAEDVKVTSSTLDSGASSSSPNPTATESHRDPAGPSSSQASSSHPSSSQQQIPSSPSRPAGFRLGSADAQPLRPVSAFASSTSAFNRPGGPADSALRSLGSSSFHSPFLPERHRHGHARPSWTASTRTRTPLSLFRRQQQDLGLFHRSSG